MNEPPFENWIKTFKSPRTSSWQLGLSNQQLHRVWDAWVKWKGAKNEQNFEILEHELKRCYQQVEENDVFFSGIVENNKGK